METDDPFLFRSYRSEGGAKSDNTGATIVQAARATSAAPSFFDPIEIDKMVFFDGGLGANNPVQIIWNEASSIWCQDRTNLAQKLNCYLSIGTGDPGIKPGGTSIRKTLKTGKDQLTETRQTEQRADEFLNYLDDGQYYRFNVMHGLDKVKLDKYQKEGLIRSATYEYMGRVKVANDSKACASRLVASLRGYTGANC